MEQVQLKKAKKQKENSRKLTFQNTENTIRTLNDIQMGRYGA